MPMSDEDRKALAREIVKQLLAYIDISIGTSIRKKIFYVVITLILLAGISFGIIKIPGVLE